jgi:hypothetical protein
VRRQETTGKSFNGVDVFKDMLVGLPALTYRLTSWLQDARELRSVNGKEQVRPVSYKLCPPNFMLNGIEILRPADSQEIAGISAVRCIPVNNQPLDGTTSGHYGSTLEFKLWADEDANFGLYDWPRFYNTTDKFSISPRIGISDPTGPFQTVAQWLSCDGGEAVRGFKWARDAQGRILGLALECAEAPRPPRNPAGTGDESCLPTLP